jgi:hypothetical protein
VFLRPPATAAHLDPALPPINHRPGKIVQPVVEHTIAWLNQCRRLAKDWECLNRKALAFLRLASIRLMPRKLCQTTI